jgi:hypothetical protein
VYLQAKESDITLEDAVEAEDETRRMVERHQAGSKIEKNRVEEEEMLRAMAEAKRKRKLREQSAEEKRVDLGKKSLKEARHVKENEAKRVPEAEHQAKVDGAKESNDEVRDLVEWLQNQTLTVSLVAPL